jgi:tellurite resistance protein TehA-like permease
LKGSIRDAVDQGAEKLLPGYFALVMATGIVSIGYWSIIFPLGMYTACTFQIGKATGLSFSLPISHCSVYVALLAWAIVFAGLIHRILRNLVVR